MGKEKNVGETKAQKLIRKGAAVPSERPWQRRKPIRCKKAKVFLGIIDYGVNLIKPRYLYKVRVHLKYCKICNAIRNKQK